MESEKLNKEQEDFDEKQKAFFASMSNENMDEIANRETANRRSDQPTSEENTGIGNDIENMIADFIKQSFRNINKIADLENRVAELERKVNKQEL